MNDSPRHSEGAGAGIVMTELQACLVLTFPAQFTQDTADELEGMILARCARQHPAGLIFDLSAIEVMDLMEWRWLRKVASGARLLGATSWFVGVRPELVATLVMLDAEVGGVHYALGVEEALDSVVRLSHGR